jgi:hypothetical protein
MVSVDLTDAKATGRMNLPTGTSAISIDLGGPLFADGAGVPQVLACLPLADGYTTTFRNLDLLAQKVRAMQLTVAGSEKVTVPAGTFDTFRVELTSDAGANKSTMWITKDTRRAVKLSQVLAQAGGATLTAELVE